MCSLERLKCMERMGRFAELIVYSLDRSQNLSATWFWFAGIVFCMWMVLESVLESVLEAL